MICLNGANSKNIFMFSVAEIMFPGQASDRVEWRILDVNVKIQFQWQSV